MRFNVEYLCYILHEPHNTTLHFIWRLNSNNGYPLMSAMQGKQAQAVTYYQVADISFATNGGSRGYLAKFPLKWSGLMPL